jgi:apolipoprotein D and lipocalin family protein
MKLALLCISTLTLFTAISCQSSKNANAPKSAPLETAARVNLSRYVGTWHEIARLPVPFQKPEEAAIAEYGKNADGTISVRNVAVAPDGSTRDIKGSAKVLNPEVGTKLQVEFDAWFSIFIPESKAGNYWVLHVDPDYRFAVVGTPSRKALWILSRSRTVAPKDYERLVGIAKARGFEVTKLIRSAQHQPRS